MRLQNLLTCTLASTLTLVVTLALLGHGTPVAAQEIVKWTDENGRVHYGDKRDAPKTSEKVTLHNNSTNGSNSKSAQAGGFADLVPKAASTPSGNQAKPLEKGKLPPLNVNLPPDVSKENLARCAQLALSHSRRDMKAMQNNKLGNTPSSNESKAEFESIKSLCPNVGYYCALQPKNPDADRCDPFAYPGNGPLLSSAWKN